MGMYDTVDYQDTCSCGLKLHDFQTKENDCMMSLLDVTEVNGFYVSCRCGNWFDYEVRHYNSATIVARIGGSHDKPEYKTDLLSSDEYTVGAICDVIDSLRTEMSRRESAINKLIFLAAKEGRKA